MSSSSAIGSASSSAVRAKREAVEWHYCLEVQERARRTKVRDTLGAAGEQLEAYQRLTAVAVTETAAVHHFLQGIVTAQEQMADVLRDDGDNTVDHESRHAKAAEENKADQVGSTDDAAAEKSLSSSSYSSSLVHSNRLMEQKFQTSATDLRRTILAEDKDDSTTKSLADFVKALEKQKRDLEHGEEIVKILQESQGRVDQAWEDYMDRASLSLELKKSVLSPSSLLTTNKNKKEASKKETKDPNNEDLWLAEWRYRSTAAREATIWNDAGGRQLKAILQSAQETESQRRTCLRESLRVFHENQQKLLVGMEAASTVALMDWVATQQKEEEEEAQQCEKSNKNVPQKSGIDAPGQSQSLLANAGNSNSRGSQNGQGVKDRETVLEFYQELFAPESLVDSEHLVLATMVEKKKGFLVAETGTIVSAGAGVVAVSVSGLFHLFDLPRLERAGENDDALTLQTAPREAFRRLVHLSKQELESKTRGQDGSTTSWSMPAPALSLPVRECTVDSMLEENTIEIVHALSATRMELRLPSPQAQISMINAFHLQTAEV